MNGEETPEDLSEAPPPDSNGHNDEQQNSPPAAMDQPSDATNEEETFAHLNEAIDAAGQPPGDAAAAAAAAAVSDHPPAADPGHTTAPAMESPAASSNQPAFQSPMTPSAAPLMSASDRRRMKELEQLVHQLDLENRGLQHDMARLQREKQAIQTSCESLTRAIEMKNLTIQSYRDQTYKDGRRADAQVQCGGDGDGDEDGDAVVVGVGAGPIAGHATPTTMVGEERVREMDERLNLMREEYEQRRIADEEAWTTRLQEKESEIKRLMEQMTGREIKSPALPPERGPTPSPRPSGSIRERLSPGTESDRSFGSCKSSPPSPGLPPLRHSPGRQPRDPRQPTTFTYTELVERLREKDEEYEQRIKRMTQETEEELQHLRIIAKSDPDSDRGKAFTSFDELYRQLRLVREERDKEKRAHRQVADDIKIYQNRLMNLNAEKEAAGTALREKSEEVSRQSQELERLKEQLHQYRMGLGRGRFENSSSEGSYVMIGDGAIDTVSSGGSPSSRVRLPGDSSCGEESEFLESQLLRYSSRDVGVVADDDSSLTSVLDEWEKGTTDQRDLMTQSQRLFNLLSSTCSQVMETLTDIESKVTGQQNQNQKAQRKGLVSAIKMQIFSSGSSSSSSPIGDSLLVEMSQKLQTTIANARKILVIARTQGDVFEKLYQATALNTFCRLLPQARETMLRWAFGTLTRQLLLRKLGDLREREDLLCKSIHDKTVALSRQRKQPMQGPPKIDTEPSSSEGGSPTSSATKGAGSDGKADWHQVDPGATRHTEGFVSIEPPSCVPAQGRPPSKKTLPPRAPGAGGGVQKGGSPQLSPPPPKGRAKLGKVGRGETFPKGVMDVAPRALLEAFRERVASVVPKVKGLESVLTSASGPTTTTASPTSEFAAPGTSTETAERISQALAALGELVRDLGDMDSQVASVLASSVAPIAPQGEPEAGAATEAPAQGQDVSAPLLPASSPTRPPPRPPRRPPVRPPGAKPPGPPPTQSSSAPPTEEPPSAPADDSHQAAVAAPAPPSLPLPFRAPVRPPNARPPGPCPSRPPPSPPTQDTTTSGPVRPPGPPPATVRPARPPGARPPGPPPVGTPTAADEVDVSEGIVVPKMRPPMRPPGARPPGPPPKRPPLAASDSASEVVPSATAPAPAPPLPCRPPGAKPPGPPPTATTAQVPPMPSRPPGSRPPGPPPSRPPMVEVPLPQDASAPTSLPPQAGGGEALPPKRPPGARPPGRPPGSAPPAARPPGAAPPGRPPGAAPPRPPPMVRAKAPAAAAESDGEVPSGARETTPVSTPAASPARPPPPMGKRLPKKGPPISKGKAPGKFGKFGGAPSVELPPVDFGPAPPPGKTGKRVQWQAVSDNKTLGTLWETLLVDEAKLPPAFEVVKEVDEGHHDAEEEPPVASRSPSHAKSTPSKGPRPVKPAKLTINYSSFTELFFSDKAEEEAKAKSALTPGNKRKAVTNILDTKRSSNLEIMLNGLGIKSVEPVRTCVMELDLSSFPLDNLRALMDVYPTDEEKKQLDAFLPGPDTPPLAKGEAFLKDLLTIDRFKQRAQCCICRGTFKDERQGLEEKFACVTDAISRIKRSTALRMVLGVVLRAGNYLNHGTNRGGVRGFSLDALGLLSKIQSVDRSTSMLRFIAALIDEQYPAAWAILDDLQPCVDASKVEIEEEKKRLKALDGSVRTVKTEIDAHNYEPKFKDAMETFIKDADHDLLKLKARLEELEALCKELPPLFAERRTPAVDILAKFGAFRDELNKARKENIYAKVRKEQREKAERERAERLARRHSSGPHNHHHHKKDRSDRDKESSCQESPEASPPSNDSHPGLEDRPDGLSSPFARLGVEGTPKHPKAVDTSKPSKMVSFDEAEERHGNDGDSGAVEEVIKAGEAERVSPKLPPTAAARVSAPPEPPRRPKAPPKAPPKVTIAVKPPANGKKGLADDSKQEARPQTDRGGAEQPARHGENPRETHSDGDDLPESRPHAASADLPPPYRLPPPASPTERREGGKGRLDFRLARVEGAMVYNPATGEMELEPDGDEDDRDDDTVPPVDRTHRIRLPMTPQPPPPGRGRPFRSGGLSPVSPYRSIHDAPADGRPSLRASNRMLDHSLYLSRHRHYPQGSPPLSLHTKTLNAPVRVREVRDEERDRAMSDHPAAVPLVTVEAPPRPAEVVDGVRSPARGDRTLSDSVTAAVPVPWKNPAPLRAQAIALSGKAVRQGGQDGEGEGERGEGERAATDR
ncbi:unnamed protein product [Vitrella brassicaformis CCMP3155]|uniref:FH2 domain-containing protein n=5 Tax=Vitrella brassicaformis TaxID=1169539 RepID=A0A0G4G5Y7_VITBC|nr:unnamed protein product [Vitrella brassicaformis CCMP3155]|eukprot:CEM23945.1 unnamed protein product [Vitrella brassicaformis CCMP3155]